MPTGRGITTTGQIGEYLTVAELCRMGFIATTFTRNVPVFDVLAIDENDRTVPIQVKTIQGKTWQFDAGRYLKIEIKGGKQKVTGKQPLKNSDLIYVMVRLIGRGKDEFFLLRHKDLQQIIFNGYTTYLEKHGGRRPKSEGSLHTAVSVSDLERFRDNWELLTAS